MNQYIKKKIRNRECPQCHEWHETTAVSNKAKCEKCKAKNKEKQWGKK